MLFPLIYPPSLAPLQNWLNRRASVRYHRVPTMVNMALSDGGQDDPRGWKRVVNTSCISWDFTRYAGPPIGVERTSAKVVSEWQVFLQVYLLMPGCFVQLRILVAAGPVE